MRISATAPSLLFSLALCAGCGSTPDTSASAPVDPEPVAMQEPVSTQENEMHREFLASLVGRWHCHSTWHPGPTIPSKVNEGAVENVMSSDGQHVISTFEGAILMGTTSDGAASYGYDSRQGVFLTERTNGRGQSVLQCSRWSFDADANCLEFVYGSLRETITSNDPDMYVTRMYKTDWDSGVEFLTMENIHTRM